MGTSLIQLDNRWTFHFPGITEDRTGPKTRCPRDRASRLVGFDGSDPGGLRPFPGFREIRTLAPDDAATVGTNHDSTSRVIDLMPFDVRQGTASYVFGACYRIRRKTPGASCDVLLEWYCPAETVPTWHVEEIMTDVPETGRISVASWGRILFVYMEGEDPKAFYVTGTGTLSANIIAAGPGTQGVSSFAPTGSSPGTGAVTLEPGNYGFAYELRDSRSGRRSGLSTVSNIAEAAFSGVAKYVAMTVTVDLAKWDRLYVWRSVSTDTAGGAFTAGLFLLDNIIEVGSTPVDAFAKLGDLALSVQDPYLSKQAFDETCPKGGACGMLDNMMVVAGIAGQADSAAGNASNNDELKNVGEIRWSTSSEAAPELFSPMGRYMPTLGNAQPMAFRKVGPALVGLGPDRLYHMRKSSMLVRTEEIHEGYGIVGHKACATMAGTLYWVSPRGLQSMASDGGLDDIVGLDDLLSNQWNGSSSIAMASDPDMGCVFLLEPTRGEAAVLWMKQQSLTELEDLPFTHVATGAWPSDPTDLASSMRRRAIWCMDFPSGETAPVSWRPVLYVADWRRERDTTSAGGSPDEVRIAVLDVTGDTSFVTDSNFSGAGYAAGDLDVVMTDRVMAGGCVGGRLVVVDVPAANGVRDETFIGQGATILAVTSGTFTLGTDKTALEDLPEGSKVCVSPVTMRWESPPLGAAEAADGKPESGFHRQRHVDGAAPLFSDVGRVPTGHAVWCGSVWSANASTPAARGVARGTDGEASEIADGCGVGIGMGESVEGIRTGYTGNAVGVGWECWCGDLDFRMLGMRVSGRIEGTERT